MKTVVYIARHSRPFRSLLGEYNSSDDFLLRNIKKPLSVEGEKLAEKMSDLNELRNVEVLYSSSYVRAMSTAKYISEKNNINLNVDKGFGERQHGVDGFHIPEGFELKQWTDLNYKIGNVEPINEVTERMYRTFTKVFNNKGKTIMIVCHATELMSLFRKYADININKSTKKLELYFNNEMVF